MTRCNSEKLHSRVHLYVQWQVQKITADLHDPIPHNTVENVAESCATLEGE
jgi:hypothetical protein